MTAPAKGERGVASPSSSVPAADMKLTYDPTTNVAYIQLRKRKAKVRTVRVSDELNVDLAADGSIYGIELLNANEQLSADRRHAVVVENEASGESSEISLVV